MDILVIDDNAQVRKMLSSYLIKNGHVVEMANDGKQGWDMIDRSNGDYDLIFTDIKMPVMNGLELLEKIHSRGFDIPVIVMTGYAVIELTLKAFKLGAYDFLTKPFEFKPLLTTLDKIESIKADKEAMINVSQYYQASVQFRIPSKTKYLKNIIPMLHSHFKPLCDFYKIDSHAIASCLFETIRNAIVFGNLEVNPAIKRESIDRFNDLIREREAMDQFAGRQVIIRGDFDQEALKFEVEDQGEGFDVSAVPRYDESMKSLPESRGMFIVTSSMDHVEWNEKGNCIKMFKYLKK